MKEIFVITAVQIDQVPIKMPYIAQTVGWFPDFEPAQRAVLLNNGDIHEGTNRFVVIEEIKLGVYQVPPISEHWYEWLDYKVNYTGCRKYKRYDVCGKPRRLAHIVNFGIG